MLIWLLFVRFVVPVLGVFYGTALMADEVDDKTITYLFTRPVPRASVLLGKYLAYLACVVLLLLPSVVIVYFLIVPIGGSIGQSFPLLAADLGMLAVGLAAYGAVFALVGAWLKRPLIVGLVFAFGWEPTVLLVPGYLKRLDRRILSSGARPARDAAGLGLELPVSDISGAAVRGCQPGVPGRHHRADAVAGRPRG